MLENSKDTINTSSLILSWLLMDYISTFSIVLFKNNLLYYIRQYVKVNTSFYYYTFIMIFSIHVKKNFK